MFLKPLIKTLLLAFLIFMVIVVLGMKFNWVDYLKFSNTKDVELALPEHSPSIIGDQVFEEESFDLQIIQSETPSVIEKMTKQQIQSSCSGLYKKLGVKDDAIFELAVGSCVVSNFSESIQSSQGKALLPQGKLQAIENQCRQKVNGLTGFSDIERQLYYGVCLSDEKLK